MKLVRHFILSGSIKSKKNSKQVIMVGGKNQPKRPALIPSKAYTAWEKGARKEARYQSLGGPVEGPVHVRVRAYFKGQEPDLSGILESVGDCLEGIAWVNDKQIKSWDGSRKFHDKNHPRTEVSVWAE